MVQANRFMKPIGPLEDRLKRLRSDVGQVFVIAMDGKSGTGKSTLAECLGQRFGAAIISGDDFFAGGTGLVKGSPEALAQICIDRMRLSAVLQCLKSGQSAQYRPFDWSAFDGSLVDESITVEPSARVILEGVYSNHPDLRPWIDFSILLRLPQPERERRLLAREGEITAWERQWHRAEDWYFEHLARPEYFDWVSSDK